MDSTNQRRDRIEDLAAHLNTTPQVVESLLQAARGDSLRPRSRRWPGRVGVGVAVLAGVAIASTALADYVVSALSADEATPSYIPYQGYVEKDGQPVDDAGLPMDFEICLAAKGGECPWTEAQSVKVGGGIFSVTLGSVKPIPASLFQSPEMYLGIRVSGRALDGRQRLMSVPYAMHAADGVPPGTVVAYAGLVGGQVTPPAGWLLCDGSSIDRTRYALLFKAIGTAHGSDGPETFRLPDYRGRFLRGLDGGAGQDPEAAARTAIATGGNSGAQVGSLQEDSAGPHTHDAGTLTASGGAHGHPWHGFHNVVPGNGQTARSNERLPGDPQTEGTDPNTGFHQHTLQGSTATNAGVETRPVNVAVNYIIKH